MSLFDRVARVFGYEPRHDQAVLGQPAGAGEERNGYAPSGPTWAQYFDALDAGERMDALTPAEVDWSGMLGEDLGGRRLPQWLADYLYEQTWLSVVVDIVPEWGTKAGWTIPSLDGEVQEALASDFEDLNATEELRRAWRFARQHGGAAVLKIVDDGRPAHLPIDRENLRRVVSLVAKDRHELLITEWGTDGRRIGPRAYQDENGTIWHPDRVVPFVNRALADRRREIYDYWSISELERLFAAFVRDDEAYKALSSIVKEYSYDALYLKDIEFKNPEDVIAKLKVIATSIKKIGKFALGADEKYETKSKTLSGLPDSVKLIAEKTAQISRIPVSILRFDSPGGLNSGANAGDWEALFGHVESEQAVHYVPAVASIAADILDSRDGPLGGAPAPKRWKVEPNPIAQADPKEKAEREKLEAERRALDVTSAIVTTEEARREAGVVEIYGPLPEGAPAGGSDISLEDLERGLAEAEPDKATAVEESALNGAQMKALVDVAERVSAGTLPREAAIGILVLSFPTIPRDRIEAALPQEPETPPPPAEGEVAAEDEAGGEPPPSPGQPPAGVQLVGLRELKERYGAGKKSVMNLVRDGRLRAWKHGGGWRFVESEVGEAFLHSPEPPPAEGDA